MIPAHFMARAVDVLPSRSTSTASARTASARSRSGAPSCGAARPAPRRRDVSALLGERRAAGRRQRWYAERRRGGPALPRRRPRHRPTTSTAQVFLDRANAFLDAAAPAVEDGLPAIQRLKWHLVAAPAEPELLEVVAFHKAHPGGGPRVRIGWRAYGDYPFLDDPRLGVPRSVYRLDTTRRRLRHARVLLR